MIKNKFLGNVVVSKPISTVSRNEYPKFITAAPRLPRPLLDAEERPGGLHARRVASPHQELEGAVEGERVENIYGGNI